MGNWKEIEIKDGLIDIIDYRGFTPPKSESGIPLISAATVKKGKLDFSKKSFINEEDYIKYGTRGFIEPGDVIITTEAPAGEVALLPEDKIYQLSRRVMALRTDIHKLNNKFLFYTLLNPRNKAELLMANRGTTVPRVLKTDITEFEIQLPDLPEQKAIAEVLSSLDDKIDLLHRQNKTLEAMAETLFRQWFVEEADESWEEGYLSDLIEVKYGKDHKKLLDGNIPVYGSGGIMRYAEKALYEKESVLIPRKGSLNNVIYINKPFWTVDTMFYTIMKRPNIAKFIFQFVKKIDLAAMNVGSAVPSMTTKVLNSMPLMIPDDGFFERFEQSITPWYDKIESNTKQIQTLTNLRDTLLPKLMSGEVRVKLKKSMQV